MGLSNIVGIALAVRSIILDARWNQFLLNNQEGEH